SGLGQSPDPEHARLGGGEGAPGEVRDGGGHVAGVEITEELGDQLELVEAPRARLEAPAERRQLMQPRHEPSLDLDATEVFDYRWRDVGDGPAAHRPHQKPDPGRRPAMARKPADMTTKYVLSERELPTRWYNIQADLKTPLPPPLHPGTGQPIGPQDLAPLFPMGLIKQEVSQERWIEIPEEVRDILRLWRPTPLYRAHRLERALDTPARIYYKYEGVSPAGSHKPNTAVTQAYYNKQEKVARLSTETGAGQWGSALAQACSFFGLQCKVYMVKVSYHQKPYRRILMETFGAQVVPSPSPDTQAGKKVLE